MSSRKKRTLSGVVLNDANVIESENKIILPATSMSLSYEKKNNSSQAVRGTEFLVEPSDCRPWKFHNRDNVWMTVDKCQYLVSSIRKNGQKVPIFARKLENDPEGKNWEIIAGRRRWFACNHLGIKVRVKATDANDRDCAILMNLENKDRDDISEFEDAISYRQQLDAKLFDSQDEMAIALDVKKSKLSKMLSAAKITQNQDVMNLFSDITLLKINPIYALVLLIEKNTENANIITQKAKHLTSVLSSRRTPMRTNVIINELMSSIESNKEPSQTLTKNYKIGEHIILKANQQTKRKIVFEFNKASFLNCSTEDIKRITLEALDEFI